MIRSLFLALLFTCCYTLSFSQVSVQEDGSIGLMMTKYKDVNQSRQTVNGWRIQIMAKTDRRAIEQAKEDFILNFPGVSVDWTHSKPYYRLRAGAFQTKLEAIQMLQSLKKKYPGVFPVNDSVTKDELISRL